MTTKIDVFPEILTTPDDLVDHNEAKDLKLRIMNTLSGNSLMCVVMEELDDSFLVALPCKLMAYGDRRVVEPYMSVRFIRLFKPTILAAIPMFGEFEQFYIKWLLENGNNLYPSYVTETAIAELTKRYDQVTNTTRELKDSLKSIADKHDDQSMSLIPIPENTTKH